ncbi:hypothetical protein HanPSC8_Chr08g0324811 [Helianthus annuus]|nr:hypothetical protein HanPSC8_Chr08g0324811 [Helianthus annuus]
MVNVNLYSCTFFHSLYKYLVYNLIFKHVFKKFKFLLLCKQDYKMMSKHDKLKAGSSHCIFFI